MATDSHHSPVRARSKGKQLFLFLVLVLLQWGWGHHVSRSIEAESIFRWL